jgi:hypothetical protein
MGAGAGLEAQVTFTGSWGFDSPLFRQDNFPLKMDEHGRHT